MLPMAAMHGRSKTVYHRMSARCPGRSIGIEARTYERLSKVLYRW